MEHEKQQVIITIGREYGSGGHLIADMLGEKYGLPVYDSTIIEVIAKEKNLNLEKLKEYDLTLPLICRHAAAPQYRLRGVIPAIGIHYNSHRSSLAFR